MAFLIMVRKERLELSHLAAPEPKSGASTNSATPAQIFIPTSSIVVGTLLLGQAS